MPRLTNQRYRQHRRFLVAAWKYFNDPYLVVPPPRVARAGPLPQVRV